MRQPSNQTTPDSTNTIQLSLHYNHYNSVFNPTHNWPFSYLQPNRIASITLETHTPSYPRIPIHKYCHLPSAESTTSSATFMNKPNVHTTINSNKFTPPSIATTIAIPNAIKCTTNLFQSVTSRALQPSSLLLLLCLIFTANFSKPNTQFNLIIRSGIWKLRHKKERFLNLGVCFGSVEFVFFWVSKCFCVEPKSCFWDRFSVYWFIWAG